jgi:dihydrofolate reductase
MTTVFSHISVSLDGYAAGPRQSPDNPLGEGGMQLHEWVFGLEAWRSSHGLEGGTRSVDGEVVQACQRDIGAYVMGRGMFGGGPGEWDSTWQGWWGDDPPFHTPVFVVTHLPREPLAMEGGTRFEFVTDGVTAAVSRAREAAEASSGGRVLIAGGASVINQALSAGVVDELQLHVVPVLLGDGARLFDGVSPDVSLSVSDVVAGNAVTHLTYRVARRG